MPAYTGESCFLYSPLWPDYFAPVLGDLEVNCSDLHIVWFLCKISILFSLRRWRNLSGWFFRTGQLIHYRNISGTKDKICFPVSSPQWVNPEWCPPLPHNERWFQRRLCDNAGQVHFRRDGWVHDDSLGASFLRLYNQFHNALLYYTVMYRIAVSHTNAFGVDT